MEQASNEQAILTQYDRYCMKFARTWLTQHNFTRISDIWDDALQCARIGLLLFIRKHGITEAEDVFSHEESPYWQMYSEMSKGILCEACAPCGIHRPADKLRITFRQLPIGIFEEKLESQDVTDAVMKITLSDFVEDLNEHERNIIEGMNAGMNPAEIARTLCIPYQTCRARIKAIRKRWTEYNK